MADPPSPPTIPPKAIDPWRLLIYDLNCHISPFASFFLSSSTLIRTQPSALSPVTQPICLPTQTLTIPITTKSSRISDLPTHEISTNTPSQLGIIAWSSSPKTLAFAIFSIGFFLQVIHMYIGQARFGCHLSKLTKEQFSHLSIHFERYATITTCSDEVAHLRETFPNLLRSTLSTPNPPQSHLLDIPMFPFLEQPTTKFKFDSCNNQNDKSVCNPPHTISSLFFQKVFLQPYLTTPPSNQSAAPP